MLHAIDPKALTDNVFSLLDDKWALITAGTTNHCNTMTASWGGLGFLWNRNVAFVLIRPERYTHDIRSVTPHPRLPQVLQGRHGGQRLHRQVHRREVVR